MRKLNFILIGVVLVIVLTISCNSPKSDNLKTVRTESPIPEVITEVKMSAPKADAAVVSENVSKGEKLFKENNCAICHQLNTKLIGPSLKDISKTYAGKKEKLNSFFKGDSKSIIDPAQHAIMEPQIVITKAMSEEDRMAIVEYLLSIK